MAEASPTIAWSSIAELPTDWQSLASDELRTLSKLWIERRDHLVDRGLLERFHERLAREWAIETGVIEGLYSLDRGTTNLLIEHGIDESLIAHGASDKPAATVVRIIRDQKTALEDIFTFVSGGQPLTNVFIRNVHVQLTANQPTTTAHRLDGSAVEVPLTHGAWKESSNNPTRPDGIVHEYCPPYQVQIEMDRLVSLYLQYEAAGMAPEVLSAWLHHRFTQIHPFQDGNGRVARALGSISLLRASWFPFIVRRDSRDEYITALEKADEGDLAPLINFVVQGQKSQFLQALALAQKLHTEQQSVQDILAAVVDHLSGATSPEQVVEHAKEISQELMELCRVTFLNARRNIERAVRAVLPDLRAYVDVAGQENAYWNSGDTISAARQLNFFAAVQTYHLWARLTLNRPARSKFDIIVTFSPVGRPEFGVMAATAFTKNRLTSEDETSNSEREIKVLCDQAFQFNGLDIANLGAVKQRFEDWLQGVEIAGLEEWRKSLS